MQSRPRVSIYLKNSGKQIHVNLKVSHFSENN